MTEDPLFFEDTRYPVRFHKQKLAFHRATMKKYQNHLESRGFTPQYIQFDGAGSHTNEIVRQLADAGYHTLLACDVHDFILEKRLNAAAETFGVEVEWLDSPGFFNTTALNRQFRSNRKRWFMADFYQFQRKHLNILMDGNGKPMGGQWSFDADNRKKVPKKLLPSVPQVLPRKPDAAEREAMDYVNANWNGNPGSLGQIWYPTDHQAASDWLDQFLEKKLGQFGDYEDAILQGENWLWHSILTPMLNIGLLTPRQVVSRTVKYAETNDVPLNSLEGFLRQIIGWREFMSATYNDLGVTMRTTNFWKHKRPLPKSFYTGETGITPVDDCIKRVLKTGYCHHIERLMVLGGFMFICEINPDDIYMWFMEMFADSYDWVMVPNVYAMSQNADGGTITTKPYFSGSAYVLRMSHYQKGDWCDIWDGLYWRWIDKHKTKLSSNPRWAMMCKTAQKMDQDKMARHREIADSWLKKL